MEPHQVPSQFRTALTVLTQDLISPLQHQMGQLNHVIAQSSHAQNAILQHLQAHRIQSPVRPPPGLDMEALASALDRATAVGSRPSEQDAVVEGDPKKLLRRLDPPLVNLAKELRNKTTRRIKLGFEHRESARQFQGKLPKKFLDESRIGWQFPKEYLAVASAVTEESRIQQADMSEVYDVERAWARLRKQHAEQCVAFLREHSETMSAFFLGLSAVSEVRRQATEELGTFWRSPAGAVYTSSEQDHFGKIFIDYLVLCARQSFALQERTVEKEAKEREKREEVLREAESLHQQADVETLVSMAKLAEGGRQDFPEGTVMHYMHSKQLELLTSFKKYLDQHKKAGKSKQKKDDHHRESSRGRSPKNVKFRTPTPFPSRSNSSRSSRSRDQSGGSRDGGRTKNGGRGSFRKRSSSGSASTKPKGKGKGKGKKSKRGSSARRSRRHSKSM